MKLSGESREQIESFLREKFGDDALCLPPTSIYVGWFARSLMRMLGMGAITFGRRVFVARSLVGRNGEGEVNVPGWLLVHEMVHVMQYEKKGFVRFFYSYLNGYWRALREGGSWDKAGRMRAYFAIAEEREAREVEDAYRERQRQV
jgi:hypothetical protein